MAKKKATVLDVKWDTAVSSTRSRLHRRGTVFGLSCSRPYYRPREELVRMTGLPGRQDVGDRHLVGSGVVPKARVALGAGMGAAIALAAVWAQFMVTVLLAEGATTALPEAFWWAVLCGIVVACGLATPVAMRLWKRGVEELRESGPDRDRTLRVPTDPAVAGPDGKHAERQLLEAIDRHGEITPARAALETALTVAEADRMLGGLAEKGHLEVSVRGGKLVYSF